MILRVYRLYHVDDLFRSAAHGKCKHCALAGRGIAVIDVCLDYPVSENGSLTGLDALCGSQFLEQAVQEFFVVVPVLFEIVNDEFL